MGKSHKKHLQLLQCLQQVVWVEWVVWAEWVEVCSSSISSIDTICDIFNLVPSSCLVKWFLDHIFKDHLFEFFDYGRKATFVYHLILFTNSLKAFELRIYTLHISHLTSD